VGYYQACERVDDIALAPTGERVATTIKNSFTSAVAFVVDGSKLSVGEPALVPYLPQGTSTSWRPAVASKAAEQPFTSASSQFKLQQPSSPSRALELIRQSKLQEKFGDFDDHLEDVSIDWLRNVDCKD